MRGFSRWGNFTGTWMGSAGAIATRARRSPEKKSGAVRPDSDWPARFLARTAHGAGCAAMSCWPPTRSVGACLSARVPHKRAARGGVVLADGSGWLPSVDDPGQRGCPCLGFEGRAARNPTGNGNGASDEEPETPLMVATFSKQLIVASVHAANVTLRRPHWPSWAPRG
jgi:hypothetical protein